MRPPDLPGYEYLHELAPGGYSMVYLYRQRSPEREVAVKVLRDLGTAMVGQLVDEANAMARLGNHANIVPVLATGVAGDGQHYIVMPYCCGPNLFTLAREGVFDVRKVLRVGVQVAGAVQAAHAAGFVHRDIKPANILTDEYGLPRLTDFGIAGRLATIEEAGDVGLSLPWSPPEIVSGGNGSVASDVYSLGATLWHLLAGRSPFDVPGRNARTELEDRILHERAPSTGRTDVPAELERLLAWTLAKEPGRRPGSADAVARELERIERALGGPVPQDWPWHTAQPTVPRRPEPELDDTSDRRPPAPASATAPAPKTVQYTVPEPVPALTIVRPGPVEPEEVPSGTGPGRWVWVGGSAAVVAVVVAVVVGFAMASGGTPAARPSTVDGGAGNQDAGALGDNEPPGVPTVTASRVDPATLRFTWTYSAPLASDTFSWRSADGTRSGTAKAPTVDVADPAGTELCVQVKVIRADGADATVDWSPKGCGK